MLNEPTVIAGRYAVLRHLGSGGMGAVYLARDEHLKREVAIKRVHAGAGTEAARRIRREAKLGAGLTHPALVTIFDTIVEEPSLLIVMEHVDGETLAERLARGRLTPDEALDVLRPVAAGLDHAHAHGIVHRDVKPANVLLGEGGAVKLADLGVALADDEVSRITREGALVGSLPYMAPEQLEPGRVTSAADVYALAAIAYEALSGRRAREGKTPLALARAASEDRVPDLRDVAPELPAAAATVLSAGMARDPDARPASAGELVERLEAALVPRPRAAAVAVAATPAQAPGEPTREMAATPPARRVPPVAPVSPPSTRDRRRRPAAGLLGAVALLAVAAVLAMVLIGNGSDGGTAPERSGTTDPATAAEVEEPTAELETADANAVSDDPSTPTGAVRAFYERAAEDDFEGAWALAGPQMRAAFGDSLASFTADLESLESIRFKTLEAGTEDAAGTPITIETVARHTDHTDRCTGGLLAAPDGAGGYLVEPSSVSCPGS